MPKSGKLNVAVTGAGGFVGRNLVEHFSSRAGSFRVIALSRGQVDLLDEQAVLRYLDGKDVDLVIHCANTGGSRRTAYDAGRTDVVGSNMRMLFNVLRACRPDVRLISMGSGAEYDKRSYAPKMPEDYFDRHVPADDYGYSKYLLSKFIAMRPDSVCLRIFGLYGKYEDYTYKFISNAIVKNLLGLPITINQDVRFDYLYINDFCRIVEHFAANGWKHKFYNATPPSSARIAEFAEFVNEAADRPVGIKILNPGLNTEYSGDNSRLVSEIPGLRFTPVREGVRGLYGYYRGELPRLDLKTVREDPYIKFCSTSTKERK